jgi:hypothetical protein
MANIKACHACVLALGSMDKLSRMDCSRSKLPGSWLIRGNPNPPLLKKTSSVSIGHLASRLFAEYEHKNTWPTIDTQWIGYSPSVNTRHLQYIRQVYLSSTRCLPVCRVSTRDTRQNFKFFLPLASNFFFRSHTTCSIPCQNLVIF